MIFSVSYKSKHKQEANEIRCPINQLGTIFEFIKNNPDKRYNIILNKDLFTAKEKMIQQIEYVRAVAPYTIQCDDIVVLQTLLDEGYNAYLKFQVTDWETFSNLKNLGVSDIYIDGPLGFQCDKLSNGKENVKIRVSPTVSANSSLNKSTNSNSFFIRPEDLSLYSDAVDVLDFMVKNQEKEDALYQIYKRGTFNYDLRDLVEGLQMSVQNTFINPEFAQARLTCGQRCTIPTKSCHLCETQLTLTNTMLQYFKSHN